MQHQHKHSGKFECMVFARPEIPHVWSGTPMIISAGSPDQKTSPVFGRKTGLAARAGIGLGRPKAYSGHENKICHRRFSRPTRSPPQPCVYFQRPSSRSLSLPPITPPRNVASGGRWKRGCRASDKQRSLRAGKQTGPDAYLGRWLKRPQMYLRALSPLIAEAKTSAIPLAEKCHRRDV